MLSKKLITDYLATRSDVYGTYESHDCDGHLLKVTVRNECLYPPCEKHEFTVWEILNFVYGASK